MIVGLQIRNFKAIRRIQPLTLKQFHVLVGPNGSGKSTLLDAIEFVRSCLVHGPLTAVEERAPEFRDLTFMRRGGSIEFDIWLSLPNSSFNDLNVKYRLVLAQDNELGVRVTEESLTPTDPQRSRSKRKSILGKTTTGRDFYKRESSSYIDTFLFGRDRLALSLTPPDPERYPTANAVRHFLSQGVKFIQLNSAAMREPAPATRPTELDLDGTNLARAVGVLLRNAPKRRTRNGHEPPITRWTDHLRLALEGLESIKWASRQPDNAEYLVLNFVDGLECPSWLLSDGTLRMLALTLPAFLPSSRSLYMVEEPENGVHPHALEIIIRALAAIPESQVFIATHSPLVVEQVGPAPLLCFRRHAQSGVIITSGADHPALRDWDGTPDLGSIFSARVFG